MTMTNLVGRIGTVVRNESEDFGRDLVDQWGHIPPVPNQVEDLKGVLLENIELKYNVCQPQPVRQFVHALNLFLVWDRRDSAASSNFSPPMRLIPPLQTYFVPKITSCSIFLVARRC